MGGPAVHTRAAVHTRPAVHRGRRGPPVAAGPRPSVTRVRVVGWVPEHDPARARAARRAARAVRWRRLARRHRRLAAAVLLAVAAGLAVDAVAPPAPVTTAVLAAAADLPAGRALRASDLVEVGVPPDLVPAAAVPASGRGALLGRVLAVPLGRGELVSTTRTLGAGLLASAPPGTLAVPVAVGTALPPGAVRAGDLVAVLAGAAPDPYAEGTDARTDGGRLLVRRATVLLAPETSSAESGLLTGTGSGSQPVALLALTTAQAEAVAGAAGTRPLTLALLPPDGRVAN